MASSSHKSGAIRALQQELKSLNDEPVEGFRVRLKCESNIFEWDVAIFGPPGTLYEGGYFKATLAFPSDYPYSPPSMAFSTKMWHPNIYDDGKVCISILHPPGDDPASGELPSERWNPTQNVRTILLSVISLLNEPNTSSPANVDASVMFRKWKENRGDDYVKIVRKQVASTQKEAQADGVSVPTRVEDYVHCGGGPGGSEAQRRQRQQQLDECDSFHDDYYDDYDNDDGDDDEDEFKDEDDLNDGGTG